MLTPGKRVFGQVVRAAFNMKEPKVVPIPAALGRYNETGDKEFTVVGHPDFVWARLRGQNSEQVRVFNEAIGLSFDTPILVVRDAWDNRYYRILRRNTAMYQDWGNNGANNFIVPAHGHQHSFGDPTSSGNDPAWIFKRQLMQPLLCHPQNPPDMTTHVEADFYFWANTFRYFAGGNSPDMTGYIPVGGSRFVTIYLEGATGTVKLLPGVIFDPLTTGGFDAIPELSPSLGLPLAAALLTASTTTVNWNNLFDLRIMLFTGSGGLPAPHALDPDEGFHTGQLKASHVSVADANNVLTSTTAEAAFFELFKREAWFHFTHFS